tara:strand:- start:340 stop:639 length:300 start_codon:yes stop_codon:yes gene_type:complete
MAKIKYIDYIEKGNLGYLVLWKPVFFGVKPEIVVKNGSIVCAQMGDANASIPTPGRVYGRPMFANYGLSKINSSYLFLSKNAIELDILKRLSLLKDVLP